MFHFLSPFVSGDHSLINTNKTNNKTCHNREELHVNVHTHRDTLNLQVLVHSLIKICVGDYENPVGV